MFYDHKLDNKQNRAVTVSEVQESKYEQPRARYEPRGTSGGGSRRRAEATRGHQSTSGAAGVGEPKRWGESRSRTKKLVSDSIRQLDLKIFLRHQSEYLRSTRGD
jgi:hypothetical protein